jgi:uncharacterized protein
MTERIQQILTELKTGLAQIYGERLERVVLFGSQARGDARPDSDIDLLVVLKGNVDVGKELWRISEVTADLSLKYSTLLSSVVMPYDHYHNKDSAFLKRISREGRPI